MSVKNLGEEEVRLLLDLVDQYKTSLFQPNSSASVKAYKTKLWEEIAEQFNANCTGKQFLPEILRLKWYLLKSNARQEYFAKKKNIDKAGDSTNGLSEMYIKVSQICNGLPFDGRRVNIVEKPAKTGNCVKRQKRQKQVPTGNESTETENFDPPAECSQPDVDLQPKSDSVTLVNESSKRIRKKTTKYSDCSLILPKKKRKKKPRKQHKSRRKCSPTTGKRMYVWNGKRASSKHGSKINLQASAVQQNHNYNTENVTCKSRRKCSPAAGRGMYVWNGKDANSKCESKINLQAPVKIQPQNIRVKTPPPKTVVLYRKLIISNNPPTVPNVYKDLGLRVKQMDVLIVIQKLTKCRYVDMFIFLRKICKNEPLWDLGLIFNMSQHSVLSSLRRVAPLLSLSLSGLIFQPDMTNNFQNLLQSKSPSVDAIVTCFNIPISEPPTRLAQFLAWSKTEKRYCMRFLIAVTSDGFIQFVSKGFPGSVSDFMVFQLSGFLDQFPHGSFIATKMVSQKFLAKKGYNFASLLGISVGKGGHFRPSYCAGLDIAIGRLCAFPVLSYLDYNFLDLISHFMIVACALANAQGPAIQNANIHH